MCGIIAGINNNIINILLLGLEQLKNRGYDSAGITTIHNKDYITSKFITDNKTAISKLNNCKNNHINSNIGVGHTRWATHGAKTKKNSHPHISYKNNFVLVHNGIIENYYEIKKDLQKKGITFLSETDTEVIVNLIEYNYSLINNIDLAIKQSLNKLQGTWGLVILTKLKNNTLYCTRKGSPLLVGYNDNIGIIASEQSAFCNKINNYISLNNNDLCKLELNNNKINFITDNIYKKINIKNTLIDLTPHPYKYWTEKEINEQTDSSLRAISLGGRLLTNNSVKLGGLDNYKDILINIDNIIILGCGTSYFAGLYSKTYFKDLCNFNTIQVIDGADFELNDIPKIGKTALILLSQSGETLDLYKCLQQIKDLDIITIGVINVVDSLIARETDCGCYLNAGREVGVASTKSFTSQVILLSMISIWFSQIHNINIQKRIRYINDLRNLHINIKNTLDNLIKNNVIEKYLKYFEKFNNCFILGKGKGEAIAKEGSLKIKEISYIHSEGYSSASLKHGPFAILEKDFPVILICSDNNFFKKNMNTYEEIKSRHANIILITNKKDINKKNSIIVDYNKTFDDLLCIIPLQILAYKLALFKNYNPDTPRNLAKVVTVE